jgi:hypothetical protein
MINQGTFESYYFIKVCLKLCLKGGYVIPESIIGLIEEQYK